MRFADLHLHTIFSDGTYSPEELVSESLAQGLSAIAVVDHDTVAGILPCLESSKGKNLEVIPGIELTAEYENKEVHLLGYFIDYQRKELLEQLDFLRKNRIERVYKITDKLKEQGVNLEPQSVFDIVKEGNPGRLHIARALVKENFAGSIFEAFKKYIGDKCPAYVSGFKLNPLEGIKLIRDSGGIPILAHPYTLRDDTLIAKFVEFGLMGLEVYYPEHSQGEQNFYLNLANQFNLLLTGGSDCHGLAKPGIKVGTVKVSYELVEKIKLAKQKLA